MSPVGRGRRRFSTGAVGALVVGLIAGPVGAAPVELQGRTSLRGLHAFDDGDGNPSISMAFLEAAMVGRDLTDTGLALHLDGTFILDVSDAEERRFGDTESLDRIHQLFALQPDLGGELDLSVGRRVIPEAGNAWVDGADVRWRLGSEMSLGLFGGLRPDPYDHGLTSRSQTGGLYGTLQFDGLFAAVGLTSVLREGHRDRDLLFNRLHVRITDRLFVASYLVFDFVDRAEVTTLLSTVDYTPTSAVNFALNVSRFSIEQYRSDAVYRNVIDPNQVLAMGDEVLSMVYNRLRFTASVKFWNHYYQYQTVDYKTRQQDDQDAWFYTIGLRANNWMGMGTDFDLSASIKNNFQSDSSQASILIDQDLSSRFSATLRGTWFSGRTIGRATERGRTFDEAQTVWLVGAGMVWRPTSSHKLDVDYDGAYETELQDARNQDALFIHTIMSRYSVYF